MSSEKKLGFPIKPMDMLTLVKEVASAASTQARIANRYWLAMVGFGLISLAPRPNGEVIVGESLSLPWIGKLDPGSYFLMAFIIFSLLAIAFASAHGQQIRADRLAHRILAKVACSNGGTIMGTHPKDLYDAMRRPSLIRVSPLPQLLQGRVQFFEDRFPLPRLRNRLTAGYYIGLKAISILIYIGLPIVGLGMMYCEFHSRTSGYGWFAVGIILGVSAAVSLIVVFCFESYDLCKRTSHIANRRGEFRGK